MMAVMRRNFGYKLVSVLIALLLYFIANNQQNPHTTNEVYVLPEVVGLPDEFVVRAAPQGFTMSVSGPTVAVNAFKMQSIKATVDVSAARVGTNKLPIIYKLPSGDMDVSGAPAFAEVSLEQKSRRKWFVDVVNENEPQPGYTYLDPTAMPKEVEVTGLPSEVGRVARVVAVVPKTPGAWDLNESVDLMAQNESQQPVDTVQIDPPRVRVHLGLKRSATSKSLVLSALLHGQPAPGFFISKYAFDPQMVNVNGTKDFLAGRSSITVPVDINGLRTSTDTTVTLTLPAGLSLEDQQPASVKVHIDVEPITASAPNPAGSTLSASGAPAATPAPTIPSPPTATPESPSAIVGKP